MKKEKVKKSVLKPRGIKSRLSKSYIFVISISLIASVVALVMLGITSGMMSQFYHRNYTLTVDAWEIRVTQQSVKEFMLSAMATDSVSDTRSFMKESQDALNQMGTKLSEIKNEDESDASIINEIEEGRVLALDIIDRMVEQTSIGQKQKAYVILTEEFNPLLEEMSAKLETIVKNQGDSAYEKVQQTQLITVIAIVVVLLIAMASIVIALRFGTKIAKSVSEPVEILQNAASKMAQGELDISIAYTSGDELGRLAEHMKEMMAFEREVVQDINDLLKEMAEGNFDIHSSCEGAYIGSFSGLLSSLLQLKRELSSTLIEIGGASEQVALGAGQLAENAQSLAEGATEQAGAVEELTAMIGGVSEMAKETGDTTDQSYKQAMQFLEEAEEGQKQIINLIDAMKKIDETSKEIENISKEIENIAKQTNLLSLNASIEAARAGEAGRGFAVVADEIGKLAADSASSAVHTRQMIRNSQEEVLRGNQITELTSESFTKIMDGIRKLAEEIQGVNSKAVAQADSTVQVEAGITQISSVIESNSASAQECSATSQELSAQADHLQELIARFKLGG